jgi:hypothetical protein
MVEQRYKRHTRLAARNTLCTGKNMLKLLTSLHDASPAYTSYMHMEYFSENALSAGSVWSRSMAAAAM